jgi:hypothetical protein
MSDLAKNFSSLAKATCLNRISLIQPSSTPFTSSRAPTTDNQRCILHFTTALGAELCHDIVNYYQLSKSYCWQVAKIQFLMAFTQYQVDNLAKTMNYHI